MAGIETLIAHLAAKRWHELQLPGQELIPIKCECLGFSYQIIEPVSRSHNAAPVISQPSSVTGVKRRLSDDSDQPQEPEPNPRMLQTKATFCLKAFKKGMPVITIRVEAIIYRVLNVCGIKRLAGSLPQEPPPKRQRVDSDVALSPFAVWNSMVVTQGHYRSVYPDRKFLCMRYQFFYFSSLYSDRKWYCLPHQFFYWPYQFHVWKLPWRDQIDFLNNSLNEAGMSSLTQFRLLLIAFFLKNCQSEISAKLEKHKKHVKNMENALTSVRCLKSLKQKEAGRETNPSVPHEDHGLREKIHESNFEEYRQQQTGSSVARLRVVERSIKCLIEKCDRRLAVFQCIKT